MIGAILLVFFAIFALIHLVIKRAFHFQGKKAIILSVCLSLILGTGLLYLYQRNVNQQTAQNKSYRDGTEPNSVIIGCLSKPTTETQEVDDILETLTFGRTVFNFEFLYMNGHGPETEDVRINGFYFSTYDAKDKAETMKLINNSINSRTDKPIKNISTGTRSEASVYNCE